MQKGLQQLIVHAAEPSSGVPNHSIIVWFHARAGSGAVSLLSQSALPAACLPPANALHTPALNNISSVCAQTWLGVYDLEQVKRLDIVRVKLVKNRWLSTPC